MDYSKLYSNFYSLFPECADTLIKLEKAADADGKDGMHVMFSFVVIPFILDLINNEETEKLKRAFGYFEQMASSNSTDITEVLEFTVIENLMSNGQNIYSKAKKFMGENMLECCKRAERYLQVGKQYIVNGWADKILEYLRLQNELKTCSEEQRKKTLTDELNLYYNYQLRITIANCSLRSRAPLTANPIVTLAP